MKVSFDIEITDIVVKGNNFSFNYFVNKSGSPFLIGEIEDNRQGAGGSDEEFKEALESGYALEIVLDEIVFELI